MHEHTYSALTERDAREREDGEEHLHLLNVRTHGECMCTVLDWGQLVIKGHDGRDLQLWKGSVPGDLDLDWLSRPCG